MKRTGIFTCSIMGVIFTLILAGYANDQQALDTETKLKQTVISIQITKLPLVNIMVFLTERAKCDLSFQIKNDEGQAGSVSATGTTQTFDFVVLKMSNHLYVARMAVTNVPVYDLLNDLIDKAGLTWRIAENGAVVVLDDATYSGIEKDYEQLKSLRKSFSTDQVKSCVCKEYENKSNDYTSVISDTKTYYVLASPWIEPRRGMTPVYVSFRDKMGMGQLYYSIYIISSSLPSNIQEMFNGAYAGASALRVSPRKGKVHSPVWDRRGERIAYVRLSDDQKEGQVEILNVKNGRETVYSGLGISLSENNYWPAISWDESGRLIAFVDANNMICLLDLTEQTFRGIWKCDFEPKSVSLSPDGNYVCFIMDWLSEVTDGRRLTISDQEQTVQEPEGSSPVLCVDTYNTEMDDWRVTIVNIQKKEIKSIGRQRYNLGILPPLLWMPDSKSVVVRTFASDEKGKCVSSYYSYRAAENDMVPYSGDQKLPYCQSMRYWGYRGSKGVQDNSVMKDSMKMEIKKHRKNGVR